MPHSESRKIPTNKKHALKVLEGLGAVLVGALVHVVLQELVPEVAVGGVDLNHAVEADTTEDASLEISSFAHILRGCPFL